MKSPTSVKRYAKSNGLFVAVLMAFAWGARLTGAAPELQNQFVRMTVEDAGGKLLLRRQGETNAWAEGALASGAGVAAPAADWPIPGIGEAHAIELKTPSGRLRVGLIPGIPFIFIQAGITNDSSAAKRIERVDLLDFRILPGTPLETLRVLGTGGLSTVDTRAVTRRRAKHPDLPPATRQEPNGSYMFLAVADPDTRHGVVSGWITSDRGSGVVFSHPESGATRLSARIDYGRLMLPPHAETATEIFVVGAFDDARIGLERYADTVAKYYAIHLPRQLNGYCTWYSRPNGGACDEVNILKLAETAKEKLAPYGFDFIQIDDKWQQGVYQDGPRMVFSKFREDGPYPHGMKPIADKLKALGLMPGLWWIPFGGKHFAPFFADKAHLFVKNDDGSPRAVKWGGTVLDLTNPAALDYVAFNARRLATEWGFEYFKLDGLWVGTGTENQYGNNEYEGDDHLGAGVVHNPDITPIEAYRNGLKTVRAAAGQPIFLLGCNIAQNMRSFGASFGLLDAMRVGPDNKRPWGSLMVGPWSGANRYFLNGRVWYNDPDPLYVSNEMPLQHAQLICSWVAVAGALNVCSDWLPGLNPDRLHLLQRTLPSHGLPARPADLFERDFPRIWVVSDTRSDRVVVGLFNLDPDWRARRDIRIDYPLEKLGLERAGTYDSYEFWTDTAGAVRERLNVAVPLESCRVLALRPRKNHPQVISTSRHITQGIVDVESESWNEADCRLEGCSRVVAGDPYELRVVLSAGFAARHASCDGKRMTLQSQGNLLRAVLSPATSGPARWTISFARSEQQP